MAQLLAKLLFGGANYRPANVGEDIILPRSTISQSCTLLGEFVQSWTISHSTKHTVIPRGGRLIASPTVAGHSFFLRRNDTGRGAPRSESQIPIIAGGNDTIIYTQECGEYRSASCAIVRGDSPPNYNLSGCCVKSMKKVPLQAGRNRLAMTHWSHYINNSAGRISESSSRA